MSDDLDTLAANGALPISVRDRIAFTPDRYQPDPAAPDAPRGAPIYYLSPLSKRERAALYRELIRMSGMLVDAGEVRAALRDAAITTYHPEEATRVCEALDEIASITAVKDGGAEFRARLSELLEQVKHRQAALSRVYPPLRELLAAQLTENDAWNTLTVRACIRDWEHLPAPCIRRGGLVTEEAMLAVPEEDLDALETRCLSLRELPRALEPDSASP